MGTHRMLRRRRENRLVEPASGRRPDPTAATVSVEESTLFDVDLTPRPAGFGEEASTSQQSFQEINSYTVPDGTLGRLREVSLSIESNGEAKVSVSGVVFGPYTGQTDFTVPLDDSVLPPGYQVRVFHQSTDGTSTTTKVSVVVLEV